MSARLLASEPRAAPEPLETREIIARAGGLVFWLMLAGQLAFNKPFAQLGLAPIYVGEISLAIAWLAVLVARRCEAAALLRAAPVLWLAAVFCVYSLARAAAGMPEFGILALRDGVIGGYALAIVPALLLPQPLAWICGSRTPLLTWTAGAALIGAVWGGALHYRWMDAGWILASKADFLTLACAAAFWCALLLALAERVARPVRAGLWSCAALLALFLTFTLPTRAIWISTPALLMLLLIAKAGPRWGTRVMLAVVALAGCALVAGAAAFGENYARLYRRYDLGIGLTGYRALPEPQRDAPVVPATTGAAEKWLAFVNPDDAAFVTREGQLRAHSIRWRVVFAMRTASVAWDRAPLLGLGMGRNLTDELRPTGAWAMFEESQKGLPNRHPHNAHVNIFVRLGVVGIALWLALLGACIWRGLGALWADGDARWEGLAVAGLWTIYLCGMSFGVMLENPFGGLWFWTLSGFLLVPSLIDRPALRA